MIFLPEYGESSFDYDSHVCEDLNVPIFFNFDGKDFFGKQAVYQVMLQTRSTYIHKESKAASLL